MVECSERAASRARVRVTSAGGGSESLPGQSGVRRVHGGSVDGQGGVVKRGIHANRLERSERVEEGQDADEGGWSWAAARTGAGLETALQC